MKETTQHIIEQAINAEVLFHLNKILEIVNGHYEEAVHYYEMAKKNNSVDLGFFDGRKCGNASLSLRIKEYIDSYKEETDKQ